MLRVIKLVPTVRRVSCAPRAHRVADVDKATIMHHLLITYDRSSSLRAKVTNEP
jgi:hypothetical protein